MLQIILQESINELEVSLSAVHPDEPSVKDKYKMLFKNVGLTMYSHSQRICTFLARTRL